MSRIINIGRSAQNDVVLDEPNISGQHAQIIIDDNSNIYLNDLTSKNGTFVNGYRIHQPVILKKGDVILFGSTKFNWENIISSNEHTNLNTFGNSVKIGTLFLYSILIALVIIILIFIINYLGYNYTISEKNKSAVNNKKDEIDQKLKYQIPKEIKYDFSCIYSKDGQNANEVGETLDAIRTQTIESSDITVTVQEEMDFAKENHLDIIAGKKVVNDARSNKLEAILNKLVAQIDKPKGFQYSIYLIDSKDINSWTCGGRIYFTTAMLSFTKSDDEVAGIIGHEIHHNELGHINLKLKAQKLSRQTFGSSMGTIAANIDGIFRSPFGKKDEAHCDFKGADICIKANYEPCNIVLLWDRMSANETNNSPISEFLSSHPFSANRRDCLKNHLLTNYKIKCD